MTKSQIILHIKAMGEKINSGKCLGVKCSVHFHIFYLLDWIVVAHLEVICLYKTKSYRSPENSIFISLFTACPQKMLLC